MKNCIAIRILFGTVVMLGWFGMIAGDRIAVRLLFGCAIGIVFAGWIVYERNAVKGRAAQRIEWNDEQLLKSIQHQRHDWMNDLQILYGYISLRKYDKLIPLMDKIKERLIQENSICKLGIPSLALFLYSIRTNDALMELDIQVEDDADLRKLPVDAERLAAMLVRTIIKFQDAVDRRDNGKAQLRIAILRKEDRLFVEFYPEGSFDWSQLDEDPSKGWFGQTRWVHNSTGRMLEWTVRFNAEAGHAMVTE